MRVRVPTPARASSDAEAAPGGAAADDGDVRGGEALLAGGADAGEEDLARVAVGVRDGSAMGLARCCSGRGPASGGLAGVFV